MGGAGRLLSAAGGGTHAGLKNEGPTGSGLAVPQPAVRGEPVRRPAALWCDLQRTATQSPTVSVLVSQGLQDLTLSADFRIDF